MAYHVLLLNCGNVDHDEDPNRPIYGPDEGIWHPVADIEEASRACRAYIERNDLGGGNWNGGFVKNDADEVVARISYNGRAWFPQSDPDFPRHLVPEGLKVAGEAQSPKP